MSLVARTRFDGIVCGHINLLPAAVIAAAVQRVPLALVIHGIDAWQPPPIPAIRWLLQRVHSVVSVSEFTRSRFLTWSDVSADDVCVIPNCIDPALFGPGPKPESLLDRYALRDRQVLLTVSRLDSRERYKGHDQVIEALPRLALEFPRISYLVVGTGDDLARLSARAQALGVHDRVVFAGHVSEDEKHAHYLVSDVYVMPGRGEGFGIVYLEALASGIPVVASALDASREIVVDSGLGTLADPDSVDSIVDAVSVAVRSGRRGTVPDLSRFSRERFASFWEQVVGRTFTAKDRRSSVAVVGAP
jgi:glycosyltransferase involved in cell wall biosynthesis